MKKILLIATGGTIASEQTGNGLAPRLHPKDLLRYVPDAANICELDTIQPFHIDSTNVSPAHWLTLTGIVEENYEKYDGFVISHGTDTLAYTAAALSFMLENLAKPVILTGSQIPLSEIRSDGRDNLIAAMLFAADLLRMYTRYAERHGWKTEMMEIIISDGCVFKINSASFIGLLCFKLDCSNVLECHFFIA